MRTIELNSLQLNAVRLNGIGECQRVSHAGAPPVVPDVPDTPVEPEPTTYTLIAEVANGVVSAKLNGVSVQLPYTATEGDVIVLEVTPIDGYEFVSWADGNTENPRAITMLSNVTLSASCEVETPSNPDVDENGYIIFENAEVARICAENWGDGTGITLEQAAAVTSVGYVFRGNSNITAFPELEKFESVKTLDGGSDSVGGAFFKCVNLEEIKLPKKLTTVDKNAFNDCVKLRIKSLPDSITELYESAFNSTNAAPENIVLPNLISLGARAFRNVQGIRLILDLGKITTIAGGGAIATNSSPFYGSADVELFVIPATVTSLGKGAISYMNSLSAIISKPTTPPAYGDSSITGNPALSHIYVPDDSVIAYREATGWVKYASHIFPISQLPTDNPELYEEIKEYL